MKTLDHFVSTPARQHVRVVLALTLIVVLASPSPAQNTAGQKTTQDTTPQNKDFKGYRVVSGNCDSSDKDKPASPECNYKIENGKPTVQSAGVPATVQRTGIVKVGDQSGDKVTTVFIGDSVETSSDSAAVITTEGSTVYVPANTEVTYGKNMISVGCGGAVVSTISGMVSNIMHTGITVIPQDEYSRYEVTQTNGTIQISAREGSVIVKVGDKETTLSDQANNVPNEQQVRNATKALQTGAKLTTLAAGASVTFGGSACLLPPVVTFPITTAASVASAAGAAGIVGIKVLEPTTPITPN